MKLEQFLIDKKEHLEQEYRKVEVKSYVSVTLNDTTVHEKFTAGNTLLTQNGREVKYGEFPVLEDTESVLGIKENGTHVVFEVVLKGKRKPIRKDFYFLWDGESNAI